MDRSKVMESALQNWYRIRQDEAMIEQFSAPEPLEEIEHEAWRQIRRAAVPRKSKAVVRAVRRAIGDVVPEP